ncbi:MAG: helix-hairpin-helix domain-containing protein [Candidatus Thorarchaeota archaeon]
MSKKKKSTKEPVQSTLGDVIEEKPKESKKPSSKKETPKKETPKKETKKKDTESKPKEKSKSTKTSKSKKKETPPATDGASKSKKETPKKAPTKKEISKKASTKKETSTKAPAKKETPEKAPVQKETPKKTSEKKAPAKKKQAKKTSAKKEPKKPKFVLEGPPLTNLPGVGEKMAEKLVESGYNSIEKISKSRPDAMSKRVEGLSKSGATRIISEAKRVLTSDTKEAIPAERSEEAVEEYVMPSLTELPGVGTKLARALESAGYNSISRLSRAQADGLAQRVDGLGEKAAVKLIEAARKYVKDRERSIILGEEPTPTIAVSSKKVVPKEASKEVEEKSEPEVEEEVGLPEPIEYKPPEKKPSKKPTKAEEAPVSKPKRKTAPKKKKPEIIRKSSGLKVPKAVEKFAKEMKATWAEVERMEAAGELPTDLPETVEVINLEASETTSRLIETATDVLNEALVTGRPAFEIPSRSGDNIVWDEFRDLLLLGMKTISRPYHSLASVVDATRTARSMEIIYQLLRSNLHATKREVFYSDVNLFRDQKYSDKIIEDVSSMLNTTRDSVHIVASARGSCMGRVVIRDGGDLIDLTKMGTGGWAVTPFLDQLEIVESDAEFILLAEKDAAIMRLAEAKFWNRQPCIVITGKGSGDIATRAFLKQLVKELEIPAFALVDSDPYGHYIYSVFLRGSKRLSYESPFIATPELKLLGVLSRDLDAFNIPKSVRIPMEPADIKRVREMLKEPFVQKNKEWVEDLKLMLSLKEKAEIQAFASHSFEYLTDVYLPQKLETGDWI